MAGRRSFGALAGTRADIHETGGIYDIGGERIMTPTQYKKARQSIGTQSAVAELLGTARETVVRRENGQQEITKEAALAMRALVEREAGK